MRHGEAVLTEDHADEKADSRLLFGKAGILETKPVHPLLVALPVEDDLSHLGLEPAFLLGDPVEEGGEGATPPLAQKAMGLEHLVDLDVADVVVAQDLDEALASQGAPLEVLLEAMEALVDPQIAVEEDLGILHAALLRIALVAEIDPPADVVPLAEEPLHVIPGQHVAVEIRGDETTALPDRPRTNAPDCRPRFAPSAPIRQDTCPCIGMATHAIEGRSSRA